MANWENENGHVTREVRTVAFKAVAYLKITYGEYTAHCANRQRIVYSFSASASHTSCHAEPPAHR